LSKALIEFQSKLIKVKKDSKNPHFGNKYASLSQIIEAIQQPLAECGLTIIQLPVGECQLETILLHTSAEWISETYTMRPQRNDPQGIGSMITYQRRYALGAMLNLNIEEDDDANTASESPKHNVEVKRNEWKQQETKQAVKIKKPMPEERFTKLVNQIKASRNSDEVAQLAKLARDNFSLTDDQAAILADWEMESANIIFETDESTINY
jgi:hypothetical protein